MNDYKIWIARDQNETDEDGNIIKPGKLHAFYDTPELSVDFDSSIFKWTCARKMFEIPSFMYPNVKEMECVVYESYKEYKSLS